MLKTSVFGVSLPDSEMELAGIADNDIWTSKFKDLIAQMEDVIRQKDILVQNHKWTELENLPKHDKLVFEMWNSIPAEYANMKNCTFGDLSIFRHTYLCEQMFSIMNYNKSKYCSTLLHTDVRYPTVP